MRPLTALAVLPLMTLFWLSAGARAELPPRLQFCADAAQWPPFSYSDSKGMMQGYTVDLVERIFADSPHQASVEQLPWRRCLAATEQGKQFQVALDASSSDERRRKFLLSRDYYQLTPYYFYSLRSFPDGLTINSGSELGQHGTICGIAGYSYTNFALGDTPIYKEMKDFATLKEMAHRGRCATFIGRFEIVSGLANLGVNLLRDPQLGYAPIPDAQSEPFYMLISRNLADADKLKQQIDQKIDALEASGELRKLKENHGIKNQ
ncbi:hypothetical protein DV711_10965 [Motiliproteus coralliicola]|uniref:Solute-binding protein family 3/N-terminal domain-containing protein n=1 Tax=Motiliproteus coralliicola TaxID=2283196 RepID=A0A369WBM9_9GAMM|nr:transporter substrate-binding domain-containing protein [Motiliproteus coralliicola]RDE19410.1 hypothetical protein DV711_10965 [Motiliproteus coralliicola]